MRRTAVINHIRGLLMERGITLRKGRRYVEEALPGILEDADTKLSGAVRFLLAQLNLELEQLAQRVKEADPLIRTTAWEHEAWQRLVKIPGIGPVTATAVNATIANGAAFQKNSAKNGHWTEPIAAADCVAVHDGQRPTGHAYSFNEQTIMLEPAAFAKLAH